MTSLCLSMIVKNEAAVIRRCLETVKPWITHWAIVDTGSTDGTQQIIREFLADLPGELTERPWEDFATNRNQALELARTIGGDHILVIDADEELRVLDPELGLGDLDAADCHAIRLHLPMADDAVWCRRAIVRASLPWRYEGEIHEVLVCESAGMPKPLPAEIMSRSDGHRNRDQFTKYRDDARTIRRLLRRRPNDSRLWYYLAQSYAGARQFDRALAAYRKRVTLEGFPEELFYAHYQIAAIRDYLLHNPAPRTWRQILSCQWRRDTWRDVLEAYLDAFNCRPTRAEPLWAAAVICNDHAMPALAEIYARKAASLPRPTDALVVHENIYRFRAADELAASLGWLGRYDDALKVLRRLIDMPQLPESERPRVRENILYLERMREKQAA